MDAELHRHCAAGCNNGEINTRDLCPVERLSLLRPTVALERQAIIEEAAWRALRRSTQNLTLPHIILHPATKSAYLSHSKQTKQTSFGMRVQSSRQMDVPLYFNYLTQKTKLHRNPSRNTLKTSTATSHFFLRTVTFIPTDPFPAKLRFAFS